MRALGHDPAKVKQEIYAKHYQTARAFYREVQTETGMRLDIWQKRRAAAKTNGILIVQVNLK